MSTTELSKLVDTYQELRAKRLDLEKQAQDVKELETAAKDAITAGLQKSGATAIGGSTHTAQLVSKDVPVLNDWETFMHWCAQHDAFDCVQRRISAPAIRLRMEDGIMVDGIRQETIQQLSIRKNR